jgi:hypothetical protein
MKENTEELGASVFQQWSAHDTHHTESLQDQRRRFSIVNREIKRKPIKGFERYER